MKDFFKERRG